MADAEDHIDIYADVDEELLQEAEYGGRDQVDLYDDALSPIKNNGLAPEYRGYKDTVPRPVGDDAGKGAAPDAVCAHPRTRHEFYIGDLTWWTTDEDLTEAVHSVGVEDILEIKFFEDRANGRSKGIVFISVGSEASSKKLMDLLPEKELHGQNPIVIPCSLFETQSWKNAQSGRGRAGPRGGRARAAFAQRGRGRGRGRFPGAVPGRDGFPGPAGPGGPPPPFPAPQTPPGPLGPPLTPAPPPHLPGPPPRAPPTAPQVNPAFLPPPSNSGMPASHSRAPPPTDPYGRPLPYDRGDYGPRGREMDTARPPLSEAEFEEIMNRNGAISSSAISTAVSHACAGDYGRAIETLVTAISLIKQSKVSADDRCKVLISSLQECLRGIECKSDGSGSTRKRSRERDHSRSGEKSQRHKSRRTDRHDGYYRERSRERERHREQDRDRDREPDRDSEHRPRRRRCP